MAGVFWCVYGKKGSGKSYFSLVDYLIPALKNGQKVYTNLTGLNRSLLTEYAEITPMQYQVSSFETLSEILEYFDDSVNCRNSVFIIDEIQNILKMDEKKTDLLFQRIAISRKQGVSFILITQVPSKLDYSLRKLADGCSLFVRKYDRGSEKGVFEYRFNQGTPIYEGEDKVLSDSTISRTLEEKYFNCYISYIDKNIVGTETQDILKRTTKIWWSRKAKKLYIALAIPLVFLVLAVFMLSQLLGVFKNFGNNITQKTEQTITEENLNETDEILSNCYSWAIADELGYNTDLGRFALSEYDSIYGSFVSARGTFARCTSSPL